MATRTDRNQLFDGNGNLISEEVVEVEIPVDPDEELADAISNANNLAELKHALLGGLGNSRVVGRRLQDGESRGNN